MPPKLHVGITFMLQFMSLLLGFGIGFGLLKQRGMGMPLLILASVVFVVVVHLIIGTIAKVFPVRCTACRSRGRFLGFGWWPFIYRYECGKCAQPMRYEVGG